eukprot:113999-Rhodomonas_salina.1
MGPRDASANPFRHRRTKRKPNELTMPMRIVRIAQPNVPAQMRAFLENPLSAMEPQTKPDTDWNTPWLMPRTPSIVGVRPVSDSRALSDAGRSEMSRPSIRQTRSALVLSRSIVSCVSFDATVNAAGRACMPSHYF